MYANVEFVKRDRVYQSVRETMGRVYGAAGSEATAVIRLERNAISV